MLFKKFLTPGLLLAVSAAAAASLPASAAETAKYSCQLLRQTSGWSAGQVVTYVVQASSSEEAAEIALRKCTNGGLFGGNRCFAPARGPICVKAE